MKQFRILSIDAWADSQNCPECGSHRLTDGDTRNCVKCLNCSNTFDENEGKQWTWNNWHQVSTFHESEYGLLTKDSALRMFADKLSTSIEKLLEEHEIEDDQYNLVLKRKIDEMPLYAVEYGDELNESSD